MSFSRALAFAALAGGGVPIFLALAGPPLGHALAIQAYGVGTAAAYAAALAPNLRRALLASGTVVAAGLLLLALPLRLPLLVVGLSLVVAFCRSGLLHRSPGLRGWALEGLLQGGGLLLATFLASDGALSLAAATWGYFLVQALFPLVGGVQLRRREPRGDPFDEARARLEALLD